MRTPRHDPITSRIGVLLTLTVLVAALGAGCSGNVVTESGEARLANFASEAEFKDYIADQVTAIQSYQGADFNFLELMLFMFMGFGGGMAAPADMANGAPRAADDGFSTTNLQEAGVDESDFFKNDATHLYIQGPDRLEIVRAVPADDMAVESIRELPGNPLGLYLKEDTLIALSGVYEWDEREAKISIAPDGYYGYSSNTEVTIFDITDRRVPAVERTIRLGGNLVASRMIGWDLHLVVRVMPTLPQGLDPEAIPPVPYGDLVPDLQVSAPGVQSMSRDIVAAEDVRYPVDPDGYSMVVVATVRVDQPAEPVQTTGIMADASTVYASPESLYLTDNEYTYDGLTRETTDIYKFDLRGDEVQYLGGTAIPGRLLNRFSLGEHERHLRAATTVGRVSRGGVSTASNGVYVLGPDGTEPLKVVGAVEGIAPTEQIYSARFVGDRGFLVTFKKVDPLFTLDLADPRDPRVVGQLKVPGYSDYIHLLDEDHLLTIGKDAVDVGDFAWYQGVQISVFDVTDFADPQRVDVEVVGDRGTESEALHDAHAFNYFGPADMLAVPMRIHEVPPGMPPEAYGEQTFQGLCLFHVTPQDGVDLMGRISTGPGDGYGGYDSYSRWTRSVFMGDFVYAVTPAAVHAVPRDDLDAVPFDLLLN